MEKNEETYIDKIQIKKSTLNKEFIGRKRELNDKVDKVDKTEHIYKEEKIILLFSYYIYMFIILYILYLINYVFIHIN